MKKIIYGLAVVAAMGTAVLLTGCGGETTVSVKNSLPQEFSAYDDDEISSTITITDINCSVEENEISVKVTGECTYVSDVYADGDVFSTPSIDAVLLDKNGNEVDKKLGDVRLSLIEGETIEEEYSLHVSDADEYTVEIISN